jgi:hypothetical protein
MWRLLFLAILLLVPTASAGETMYDSRGDIHVSASRLTAEHAVPEIDILEFQLTSNASHVRFRIAVADLDERSFWDGVPLFAVTFANREYEFAALTARPFADEPSYHLAVENASGWDSHVVEGTIVDGGLVIDVPRSLIRSDLDWVVVSSMLKVEGPGSMVDGGPVWFRDSLPDEGDGPPQPIEEEEGLRAGSPDGPEPWTRRPIPWSGASWQLALVVLCLALRRPRAS